MADVTVTLPAEAWAALLGVYAAGYDYQCSIIEDPTSDPEDVKGWTAERDAATVAETAIGAAVRVAA